MDEERLSSVHSLDVSLLYSVLERLRAADLAVCLSVCKQWRQTGSARVFWMRHLQQLDNSTHLHEPAFQRLSSSIIKYVGWRVKWWSQSPGTQRLLVEKDRGSSSLSTYDLGNPASWTDSGSITATEISHDVGHYTSSLTRDTVMVEVQQSTWSPTGNLAACTIMVGRRIHIGSRKEYVAVVGDNTQQPIDTST